MHTPISTICGAAIADGSIPKSGGCVGIGKVSGLSSYPATMISNGIKIKAGPSALWSFNTFKVDSPDFSKSDIRILNHKGEPDYQGRVEFRLNGKWGTVNFKNCE